MKNENENIGIAKIIKFFSFLINGILKMKRPMATKKNNIPPHADNPRDKKHPAKINFTIEIFPLLFLIPETNRYTAINPKNSPKGSDLNQPIRPLEKIGIEIENINAANKPDVVPPKTLTNAKTTIDVSEPITNGNNIVKLYRKVPNPNN